MKAFPTCAVMSIAFDRMLCQDAADMYRVLEYMIGGMIFPRELGDAIALLGPYIFEAHPELIEVAQQVDALTPDDYERVMPTWLERFGETLTVPRVQK